MSETKDIGVQLQQRVEQAIGERTPLRIRAGGSKDFYGREPVGELLDLCGHRGIINYEPTELVITARAATPLREIEEALSAQNQQLTFDPPNFDGNATLGGTIACNLSGHRRPYAGAARDAVLGSRVLNGKGEILRFGGEVMKNVAGYDVSRLMAGAMGTLGILLEVSLKVVPRSEQEITLVHEGLSVEEALQRIQAFSRLPLTITASSYVEGRLFIRICGTQRSVEAGKAAIGGDELAADTRKAFWTAFKNQAHPFFADPRPLWRFSVAANCAPLPIEGAWLYEWGGAQRWVHTDRPAGELFALAEKVGGHASAYRNAASRDAVFQPLAPGMLRLHKNLKQAFDPHGILNPGRLYADL